MFQMNLQFYTNFHRDISVPVINQKNIKIIILLIKEILFYFQELLKVILIYKIKFPKKNIKIINNIFFIKISISLLDKVI